MKDFYEPPQVITPDMEAELVFVAPRGTSFWKKFLIYCCVWIAVIGIACCIMWSVMQQYEDSLPTTAMDEYITSSRQDMFFFAISETFEEIGNPFESAFDIASTLSKEFSGDFTYTKLATEYTHDNPVYIIKHDGENLFKVSLEKGEETGFMNFREYFVNDVELVMPDLFTLSSYKVIFATNMLIYINNTSLGTDLENFEQIDTFGNETYLGVVVENFTYEPKIVAVEYQNALAPDKVVSAKRVGQFFVFEREDKPLSTITVTVPSEAVVYIDEKEVSSVFISEKYTETSNGSEFATEMTVYTIPTVSNVNSVTATLNGKELTLVQDDLSFTAVLEETSCTVTVPEGAELYLNGKLVDTQKITAKDAMWHSDFDEIKNYPTAVQYTLNGVVTATDLTAKLDGEELTAYRDGNSIVFTSDKSEELKAKFGEQATEFVHQYLFYNTQGYRNTAANLANTLKLVAPGSPLRSYLNLANIGIEYKSPQKMDIEYLTADNFVPFGEDAFVCDVSYKATLNDSVTEVVEENVIHLIFIRSGNGFLPAKFIL